MSASTKPHNVLDLIWELSTPVEERAACSEPKRCAAPTEEEDHDEADVDPEARARRAALLAILGPEMLAERDALHAAFGIPRDAP